MVTHCGTVNSTERTLASVVDANSREANNVFCDLPRTEGLSPGDIDPSPQGTCSRSTNHPTSAALIIYPDAGSLVAGEKGFPLFARMFQVQAKHARMGVIAVINTRKDYERVHVYIRSSLDAHSLHLLFPG